MNTHFVRISPQGQITIPSAVRRQLKSNQYMLELREGVIFMKPCVVMDDKKNIFTSKVLIEAVLRLPRPQRRIYNMIRKKPCSMDFLCGKTQMTFGQMCGLISPLQMKGVIRMNRQGLYEAVDFGTDA